MGMAGEIRFGFVNFNRFISFINHFLQSYQQQAPNISMGNSVSDKFDTTAQKSRNNSENEDKKKSPVKNPAPVKAKKGAQPGAAGGGGGGWFGGIFSKLTMKPKNQMILPDDKNPTVT